MAAVLSALAPYVLQMIKDLPEEELRMLLGISGEIETLGDKVANLQAYVADAERRRIDDARVQGWVSKLKSTLYDATDALELCQLDADERRRRRGSSSSSIRLCWTSTEKKAPGWLRPLLFCLGNPAFAHAMGRRIKALNARLDGISKDISSFGFAKLDSYQLRTPPGEATPRRRTTTSLLDGSAIVGDAIEEDTRGLVQELLAYSGGPQGIKVVSIVGPGGMGKTTLAKKIFNHGDIQAEFRSSIWLSVTDRYDEEKLLSSAVTQAGGGEDPGGDKQILSQTLAGALSTGKFLLVMDDVWSDAPWADVLQSPVVYAAHKQPGSRVIVTTRNQDLVKHMGAVYHQHRVKPMCITDAWSLLEKQLPSQDFGSEITLDDKLKLIGMEIVKKCDGLPLAIKAVGGLLRTKRANEREWKSVLDDPTWSTDKTHEDLNSALRLSYEDLSPPLKQCFLYCALLQKGCRSDIVIGMWMSEGFLEGPSHVGGQKEVEDIGMGYYRDLITRNLLEPVPEAQRDGSMCMMHDVILSFAQHMAKEEALVVRHGQISPLISSTKFRRLSIETTKLGLPSLVTPKWSSISGKQELLRTLIIDGMIKFEPNSETSLSRLTSLRVLLVRHAQSDRLIESLGKLKLLRFLFLEYTDISRLPDDIDKLKFLQQIVISRCGNFAGHLPSSMLKLERLRNLSLVGTKFVVPWGLGGLANLRVLEDFPVQTNGEWCSLQELGPLSQLRVLVIRGLEAVPSSSSAAQAKISDKEHLSTLVLLSWHNPHYHRQDCQLMEEVFDQLCPPPHLETLIIPNYIGRRPPSWMCMSMSAVAPSINFRSLTVLQMSSLPFCTELPDGLCRLPSLEDLVISFALSIKRIGPEFQNTSGSSTSTKDGRDACSFPKLQELSLCGLREWKEWDWPEDEAGAKTTMAMPSLQTLRIIECKLGRLPAGLASSRRLHMRHLLLVDVARVTAVETFPSVVSLVVVRCPVLKIIHGLPSMRNVKIQNCPELEVLEECPALDTMDLEEPGMEKLPGYVVGLKLRILRVSRCHQKLRDMLLTSSSESTQCCEKLIVL